MINDSGNRREFATGAVRDMPEGKGRFDLMPLGVVAIMLDDDVYNKLNRFLESRDACYLYQIWDSPVISIMFGDRNTALLEVAIHFEEGSKKYGENNWKKGIPVESYIDSAARHYTKWRRGDKDERHDRAFLWNVMCAIWTVERTKEGD